MAIVYGLVTRENSTIDCRYNEKNLSCGSQFAARISGECHPGKMEIGAISNATRFQGLETTTSSPTMRGVIPCVAPRHWHGIQQELSVVLFLGIFVFLPIAVNLFLIQHKESKRYLCGENNQLFGLVSNREDGRTLERKHRCRLSLPFAERPQ